MRIESLYHFSDRVNNIDISNYYLGLTSYLNQNDIRIQIENMTLFNYRNLPTQTVIPNTKDYYVVIDSIDGLYIGMVREIGVKNTDNVHKSLDAGWYEEILPSMHINLLGYSPKNDNEFRLPSFHSVGIGDKVYVANQKVVNKYLESIESPGELKVGENKLVNEKLILGKYTNLQDKQFEIHSNNLFNRHLMIVGATGTGKSTSALTILDELSRNDKKILMIDSTGEYKNTFNEEEISKYTLGEDTYLSPGEVSIPQWAILFKTNDGTQPSVIANAITSLKYQYKKGYETPYIKDNKNITQVSEDFKELTKTDKKFSLELLTDQIRAESVKESKGSYKIDDFTLGTNTFLINKVEYLFNNTDFLDFFNPLEKDLYDVLEEFMLNEEKSIYIDASNIGGSETIGPVIVDLITNYLLMNSYGKDEKFSYTLFIDEVHRYTGKKILGEEVLTGLEGIAREGRKLGIYLFLTTQSPLDVPDNLFSQVGTIMSHRLTHQNQLYAIKNYLEKDSFSRINKLAIGEVVLTSSNLLQDVNLKMSESNRKHYNESPIY